MLLVEAVSIRIKKILAERNITRYKLAKDGGIPRQTLAKIVRIENKTISLNTVYQVAATLEMSLSEFFDDPIFNEVTE